MSHRERSRARRAVTAGRRGIVLGAPALAGLFLGACTPTVKVATDDPITINLNINIQHEIRVKVERELDAMFSEDSELF